MAHEQQKAKDHLRDLLELEDGLTDWEVNFIDDMSRWEGDFTEKQIAMIYKIYERRC
jgi:hypothetical protein